MDISPEEFKYLMKLKVVNGIKNLKKNLIR